MHLFFYPRSRSKFDLLDEMLENYYTMLGLADDDDIDVLQIFSEVRYLINKLLEFYCIHSTLNDESASSTLRPPSPH